MRFIVPTFNMLSTIERNIFVGTLRPMKRDRGRPPKPPEERKATFLKIRVTDDDLAEFQRASGGNVSQWVRETLLRAARRTR